MCGIVAAVSSQNIVPVLLQGLSRLEYRGYDSCGVAVHANGVKRARSTSRVAELEAQIKDEKFEGHTGIAHTRWATHGVRQREVVIWMSVHSDGVPVALQSKFDVPIAAVVSHT